MVPSRPSLTAEAVCLMRAAERGRPPDDRILDDPYAELFLGPLPSLALGAGPLARAFLPALGTYVLCRHRLLDDALVAALRGGTVEQVVVLGAGYDARAWRFADALAGRPLFEVDFPATQARKLRLLAGRDLPAVDVRRVPIDFRVDRLDAVLAGAGFRAGRPTFFIWEGVSMYLPEAAITSTLTTLHALGGPGSALAMDFLLDRTGLASAVHHTSVRALSVIGEPIRFSLPLEAIGAFSAARGWTVTDLADASELARRYVRDGRRVYPATACLVATRS